MFSSFFSRFMFISVALYYIYIVSNNDIVVLFGKMLFNICFTKDVLLARFVSDVSL